jgi:secreted trypsin-like serine protease
MPCALLRLAAPLLLLAAFSPPAFAVFGGRPVGATDLVARSLAAVLYRTADGAHLCTAVVLSPRLVLTAAHCTGGDRDDIRIIFSNGLSGVPPDRLRDVEAVSKPPPTPAAKGSYAYNDPDDIALVLLDSAAPADALPVRLAASAVTNVRIAGYGATADLRLPNAEGKRQLGFGQGLRAATASLRPRGPTFVAAQPAGAGMCTGDSGGPAFVSGRDGLSVVGLLIGVSAPRGAADFCRGTAWFTSIPRWRDWIGRAAADLGAPLR